MPSSALQKWRKERRVELDEIVRAHAAVGGTGPGRRFATQQINRAYAVLLASQFQGFCRDLHTECVDHLARAIQPAILQPIARAQLTHVRSLDRGNAQPSSIGSDFNRLGVNFWDEVERLDAKNAERKKMLGVMNDWRNAIVHQDFDPRKLGGLIALTLAPIKRWRKACNGLSGSFDEVMFQYLRGMTAAAPW